MQILITTAREMGAFLEEELRQYGFTPESRDYYGIRLEVNHRDIIFLNFHLRTAHRILVSLKKFKAENAEALYREIYEIPWNDYLLLDRVFSIHSSIRNETIKDTRFAALKCKDAIVDKMRKTAGLRPNSDNSYEEAVIFLRWQGSAAEIFLDSSGNSLHRRGYRLDKGPAPMQETLAAALLMAAEWKKDEILLNPMCGSGTIAIEGAMMAAGIPPGLHRSNWSFMHFKDYDPSLFREIKKEAIARRRVPETKIMASDIDRSMIRKSRNNARRAGVEEYIDWAVSDFRDIPVPEGPGLIILNPEYGERTGEEEKLVKLYREIGDFLKKKCPGKTAGIFTTNPRLQKSVGLKTKRKIPFYTGPLEGRLLLYELYEGKKG